MLTVKHDTTSSMTSIRLFFSFIWAFTPSHGINPLQNMSHCPRNCTMMYYSHASWSCLGLFFIVDYMESYFLINFFLSTYGKMTRHHLDSGRGRTMAAFLERANWPPHESVEMHLLPFQCSIGLCMNFFHL